jgi:hypothetical protein
VPLNKTTRRLPITQASYESSTHASKLAAPRMKWATRPPLAWTSKRKITSAVAAPQCEQRPPKPKRYLVARVAAVRFIVYATRDCRGLAFLSWPILPPFIQPRLSPSMRVACGDENIVRTTNKCSEAGVVGDPTEALNDLGYCLLARGGLFCCLLSETNGALCFSLPSSGLATLKSGPLWDIGFRGRLQSAAAY